MSSAPLERIILDTAEQLSVIETERGAIGTTTAYTQDTLQKIHTILSTMEIRLPELLHTLTTHDNATIQLNILFIISELILLESFSSRETDEEILNALAALNAKTAESDIKIGIQAITTFLDDTESSFSRSSSGRRSAFEL